MIKKKMSCLVATKARLPLIVVLVRLETFFQEIFGIVGFPAKREFKAFGTITPIIFYLLQKILRDF